MSKIIMLTMLFAGLSGCGSKLEIADVVGTYQAVYSFGIETLTLKTDGAYEQSFKYNDGKELSNKGTWEFRSTPDKTICLNDALIVDDHFGNPSATAATPQSGCRGVAPKKNILTGSVSLSINEDLGLAFKKK